MGAFLAVFGLWLMILVCDHIKHLTQGTLNIFELLKFLRWERDFVRIPMYVTLISTVYVILGSLGLFLCHKSFY